MVGAIVLSPTNAASQESVVGSAQRVVVARVGLHVTQSYSIFSSTSALSIRILSSREALFEYIDFTIPGEGLLSYSSRELPCIIPFYSVVFRGTRPFLQP